MRRTGLWLVVIALALSCVGCVGGGPAASHGGRGRCGTGSASTDDQRPLFFLLCVESP